MNNDIKNTFITILFAQARLDQSFTGQVSLQGLKNSIKKWKPKYKAEYDAALFRVCNCFDITVD